MKCWHAVWLYLLLLGACSVDELDLSGRECPCVDGWVCDEASNVCVEAAGDSGADSSARPDADAGGDATPADTSVADSTTDTIAVDTSTDTADPGPASLCDTVFAGRLFCDGFESGDLVGWDQRMPDGSDVTVIDASSGEVYRGDHALQATGAAGSTEAAAYERVFTADYTDQWLRAYYFIPASPPLIAEIFAFGNGPEANAFVSDDEAEVHAHGYAGDGSTTVTRAVPRDTWVCVELHVAVDASAGVLEMYWDDELIVEYTGDTTYAARLETIGVGLPFKEASAPETVVYVDEVVADTARIGCD